MQYFKVVYVSSYRHLTSVDPLIRNSAIIKVEEETKILKFALYIELEE